MRCKVCSWRSVRPHRTPSVLTRRSRALCRANFGAQESADATLCVFSPSKVTDLGDDMSFTPIEGEKDVLTCNVPDIPTDDSNLVIKALNLFRERTGSRQHYAVVLDKRVPHGGGVGGGSGNAATSLWAANRLCGEPASNEELLQWSGDIGSDISVFFSCGAAYCTGRGEVVENVNPPLPLDLELLLVKPPMGLATPAIFKALDLSRLSTADPLQLLSDMKQFRQLRADLVVNDLEPPAFASLPELKQLKERLAQEGGFDTVFMTGSGSTLVCVGSASPPAFLSEPQYEGTFVSPAHLIQRQPGEWYRPHTPQAA